MLSNITPENGYTIRERHEYESTPRPVRTFDGLRTVVIEAGIRTLYIMERPDGSWTVNDMRNARTVAVRTVETDELPAMVREALDAHAGVVA